MQIVIDIPEEDYIRLRDEGMFGNVTTFKRAVREGIPLEGQESCEDAIKYFNAIYELSQTCGLSYGFIDGKIKEIIIALKKLPSVKPVEKVGRWINPTTMQCMKEQVFYYCSVCGNYADANKYCPNCGAKMEGEQNG